MTQIVCVFLCACNAIVINNYRDIITASTVSQTSELVRAIDILNPIFQFSSAASIILTSV